MVKEGFKECPYCGEEIREKAIICRFCNRDLRVSPEEGKPIPPPREVSPKVPQEVFQKPEPTPSVAPQEISEKKLPEELEKLKKVYPEKLMDELFIGLETIQVGERRTITILFADICGFTSLSENLDPEQIKEIIDGCYGIMAGAIKSYGGMIDKFLGDAVMALYGAPAYSHEDDPERAIRAGLQIQEKIVEYGHRWDLDMQVSIGINCGDVVVGQFGTEERFDYTAIGDTVNLASRLQGVARAGEVVVGEGVFRRTRNIIEFEFLGAKDIKGKKDKVNCYSFKKFKEKTAPSALKQRSPITALVGREKELKKLTLAYENARDGKPQVVLVIAEAGVGKSRLVYQLSQEIQGEDFYWLNGAFLSYGQNIPYLPIVEVIKKSAGVADEDSKDSIKTKITRLIQRLKVDDSETIINAIEFLLSVHSPKNPILELPGKDRKQLIFRGIEKIFLSLAGEKKLILVFEDVHWGDSLSIEFFDYFLSRLSDKNLPILLIFNYRPALSHIWQKGPDYIQIELEELSTDESQTLLYQILGIGKLPADLEQKLLSHAEGNPFFLEEIILALREDGTIVLEPQTGLFKLTQPVEAIKLPETIQGVVLARVDQLESQLRKVLQCASVIGIDFKYRVLQYILDIEQRLRDYLGQLVDQEYLLEKTAITEIIYLFKHYITREVIYSTLLRKTRKFFHSKIGLCLEEIYKDHLDENYEILAHHFHNSDLTDKALYYLEKAAQKTQLLYANESAIEFYSYLIEILKSLKELDDEQKRLFINAYSNRGKVRKLIGEYSQAIEDFEKGIELAKKFDVEEIEATILKVLADIYRLNGRHSDALEILERARVILHNYKNISGEILTINNIGALYRTEGRHLEAAEKYRESLALAEEYGDLEIKATALNNLGITLLDLGEYEQAMENFLNALDIKKNLGDKKSMVAILNNIGIINERKGEYEQALKTYAESLKIALEIGYHRAQLACHLNLGQTSQILGDMNNAISHFKRVIEKSKGSEDYGTQAIAYGNLAWTYIYQRNLDPIPDLIGTAIELAEKGKNYTGKINALLAKAMFLALKKNYNEGVKTAEEAINEVKKNKDIDSSPTAERIYAINLLGLSKLKDALQSAETAFETASRTHNPRETAWSLYAKGIILKEDGKLEEGERDVSEAIEMAKKIKDLSFIQFNCV